MANSTVYPYGTGGSLPASIGIINDLTTGGADKALSAQQGVVLQGEIPKSLPWTAVFTNGVINANNTNQRFEVPEMRIFDDSGSRLISAQNVSYNWGTAGRLWFGLVVSSDYSTLEMVEWPVLNNKTRLIAFIKRETTSSSDHTVTKIYGGTGNLLFTIDGVSQTGSEYDSLMWNNFFTGKGSTYNYTKIFGTVPGHVYRVIPQKTTWTLPTMDSGQYKFEGIAWVGSNSSYKLFTVTRDATVQPYYDFYAPLNNYDFISIGGRAVAGEKFYFNIIDITYTNEADQPLEVAKKKVTNTCGNQGLTIVGDKVIHFKSAADDHSAYADLLLWNKSDYSPLTKMTHNLGHAATCDYNADYDTLAVSNGTLDNTVMPRLDLVTNASSKITAGGQISYSDTDIIHIELATANKQIGGTGLVCTFGGNGRIIYLATGQSAAPKIFRCVLGVGTQDFSDQSAGQNDATKWGTFISGKADTEFNGTLKVLSSYSGPDPDTYQGMCYRNGYIYMSCGLTRPQVHKISLGNYGRFNIVKTNLPVSFNANGNETSAEPEGLCFVDNQTMLLGIPTYGGLFEIESF